MDTFLICQHITVTWSRDACDVAAVERRRVIQPVARLPLPPPDPSAFNALTHAIAYSDYNGRLQRFEQLTTARLDLERPFQIGSVHAALHEERLFLEYRHPPGPGRTPTGSFFVDVGSLAPDQWAQVICNGRFSSDGWFYALDTINIGLFTRLESSLFISADPDRRYRQLAAW
jgi:hypothetical protein